MPANLSQQVRGSRLRTKHFEWNVLDDATASPLSAMLSQQHLYPTNNLLRMSDKVNYPTLLAYG
jgi:hypothetical protein